MSTGFASDHVNSVASGRDLSAPEVQPPQFEVAVIGAGIAGICAGYRLRKAGVDNFVILDRDVDFGGQWRTNTYPGVAVDIPSFAFQFTFFRNPDWSRVFAEGAEVQAYLLRVVEHFDLRKHAKFGIEIEREVWHDEGGFWSLHLVGGGEITARFVIRATGFFLDRPKGEIGIPGQDLYAGKLMPPNGWDHDYDYRGKRVAVIGTGPSAVQIAPELAKTAAHVDIFQRTAVWSVPKPDLPLGPRARKLFNNNKVQHLLNLGLFSIMQGLIVFATSASVSAAKVVVPPVEGLIRMLYRGWLMLAVRDRHTRRQLMPQYGFLGNQPTLNTTFVRSLNRPNTRLLTTGIERFTEAGLRTVDGVEYQYDVIVPATGYLVASDIEAFPVGTVTGKDGFDLGTFYREHKLQAFGGVTLPQTPNRWMLFGPYSWTSTGWPGMKEEDTRHAVRVIAEARARGAHIAEVTQQAHDQWHELVVRGARTMHWYLVERQMGKFNVKRTHFANSQKDNPAIRPSFGFRQSLWRHSIHFVPSEAYTFRQSSAPSQSDAIPEVRSAPDTQSAAV
ncbi:flavin-containing monooxygenase [Mycobacteroides abscessus]|uniref:flavin-containing monooxygenase n=1 Tax=Mycobacteroides abscessus TaxID=36809 RepID=UPI001C662245|nr:NAD(P)/FAD-dependent oxidoreductase [Mycobacteroides abscessus]